MKYLSFGSVTRIILLGILVTVAQLVWTVANDTKLKDAVVQLTQKTVQKQITSFQDGKPPFQPGDLSQVSKSNLSNGSAGAMLKNPNPVFKQFLQVLSSVQKQLTKTQQSAKRQ